MMFVRKLVSLACFVALALPLVSQAETNFGDRTPAAAKHKNKKAKKAKKGGKAKKSKSARAGKGKKKSHAPSARHESGANEGVSHTPPEMKEDLPAPSAESTTEH